MDFEGFNPAGQGPSGIAFYRGFLKATRQVTVTRQEPEVYTDRAVEAEKAYSKARHLLTVTTGCDRS